MGPLGGNRAKEAKLLPVSPLSLSPPPPPFLCSALPDETLLMLYDGRCFFLSGSLAVLNIFKNSNINSGDIIDYAQQRKSCLGELIEDTLQLFEQTGGEDAFINIKYMIPTYESCIHN